MDALMLQKAREFARVAHAGQERKYTGQPYFTHLEEVASLVRNAGLSDAAVVAAYLHDTVEDTTVTLMDIIKDFGPYVASLVQYLTDTPPGPGLNREKRKTMDITRLARASSEAQSIKCADLISNTSSIVTYDADFAKIYLPEKRHTLEVLTNANPTLLDMATKSLKKAEEDLLQAALKTGTD